MVYIAVQANDKYVPTDIVIYLYETETVAMWVQPHELTIYAYEIPMNVVKHDVLMIEKNHAVIPLQDVFNDTHSKSNLL